MLRKRKYYYNTNLVPYEVRNFVSDVKAKSTKKGWIIKVTFFFALLGALIALLYYYLNPDYKVDEVENEEEE
jgi:cytochrome c biogenesis factor